VIGVITGRIIAWSTLREILDQQPALTT
jgi:hypothetical protein